MKKVTFRKDTVNASFTTAQILTQILSINKGEGGSIKDMAEKIDLIDRITAANDADHFVFKDNEYDTIKRAYENNGFPVNNRFFVTIWEDIKNYTSVDEPKAKPSAVKT